MDSFGCEHGYSQSFTSHNTTRINQMVINFKSLSSGLNAQLLAKAKADEAQPIKKQATKQPVKQSKTKAVNNVN
jgi:hypothetical protein